jgi:ribonucleoside-diphosphate reductase alpha chain
LSDQEAASGRWNWQILRESILQHGAYNSLLVAPMPTASTAQILGNTECFEPYTSNIYNRKVLAGEFTVVNKHLVKDLISLNLWDEDMRNKIIFGGGSVQHIPEIPDQLKRKYKTAFEMSNKVYIDMAADRGLFVDQSQSLNIFMDEATLPKLSSCLFYGYKKRLKTLLYYLRSKPAVNAIKDLAIEKQASEAKAKQPEACSRNNPNCESCSS